MLIRAGYQIEFNLHQPTVIVAMLNVVQERRADLLQADVTRVHANGYPLDGEYFKDRFGNCCLRVAAPPGPLRFYNDFTVRDSGLPTPLPIGAPEPELTNLPSAALEFLLPSRYCEVDKLTNDAWWLFGHFQPGWGRAKAVLDWVQSNVEFGYHHARKDRTAMETYRERRGVCRDLNHLALTFCRALNIPARYATGYLGDIGVPANPSPMDFSACFEVFLDGRWWLMDARHNQARIGWVLLARGRDAADCAITTSFGPTVLTNFSVWTKEVAEGQSANPPIAQPNDFQLQRWSQLKS